MARGKHLFEAVFIETRLVSFRRRHNFSVIKAVKS
jgi:hypothetical protein